MASITLRFKRKTTSELASLVGTEGEIVVDKDKDVVVVMDGSTHGGFPMQSELVSSVSIKTINGQSILGSGDVQVSSGSQYVLPTASETVLGGVKVDGSTIIMTGDVISASQYNLPPATDNRLGGIKVGTGLTIDTNGVLSNSITQYPLPTASSSVLGGVMVGSGLVIDANGVLSNSITQYSLPTASDTTLGGVKVDGTSISISNGTISAVSSAPYSLPTASSSVLGGVKVGTGLATDANGVLSSTITQYSLPTASDTTLGGVRVGSGLAVDANGVLSNSITQYSLPTASDTILGGIKVGSGLVIDANGVLSSISTQYSLPTASDTTLGGVKVDGTSISINNGTISAVSPTPYSLPTASDTTLGGVKVGTGLFVDANGVLSNSITQYSLPTASDTTLGGVKVDGTSISISNGTISAVSSAPYSLPTASSSVLGGVKVDGTSISISNGVISSAQYSLPTASSSTLGGVKVGTGLAVSNTGELQSTLFGGNDAGTTLNQTGITTTTSGFKITTVSPNDAWYMQFGDLPLNAEEQYSSQIVYDSAGNIIVVGANGNTGSIIVAKFTSVGDAIWQKSVVIGAAAYGSGDAVDTDADNNIYFTMTDNNNAVPYVVKLSSTGDLQWSKKFATLDTNNIWSLVLTDLYVAADGGICVCGAQLSNSVPYTGPFVTKFSASGTVLWHTYINGVLAADYNARHPQGIACDGSSNVYVSIEANRASDNAKKPGVIKLDSSGAIVWQRFFDLAFSEYNRACTIDIDTTGVYVSARIGFSQCMVVKLNSAGTMQWSVALPANGSNWDFMSGLRVSTDGHLYTLSHSPVGLRVNKLSKDDGTAIWTRDFGSSTSDTTFWYWSTKYIDIRNGNYIAGGYTYQVAPYNGEMLLFSFPTDGTYQGSYGAFAYNTVTPLTTPYSVTIDTLTEFATAPSRQDITSGVDGVDFAISPGAYVGTKYTVDKSGPNEINISRSSISLADYSIPGYKGAVGDVLSTTPTGVSWQPPSVTPTGTVTLTNKTFANATVVTDNSANPALKVSQAGSGPALLVEVASTSPPLVVSSTGVLFGATPGSGTTEYMRIDNKGRSNFKGAVTENKTAMSADDIDLSLGNLFTKTITGTTTLTVSNVPDSGTVATFILDLTNGGSAAITWWSGTKWAGGTAPTLTSAGRDVLGFFTHDGGTTWSGLVLGKDVK